VEREKALGSGEGKKGWEVEREKKVRKWRGKKRLGSGEGKKG